MSSQTIEEKNYERLRSAVQLSTGVTLPEFDNRNAKRIRKFLIDFGNENASRGKAEVANQGKDEMLKKLSMGSESEPLKKAVATIIKNFEHKSVHEISFELKKLNKLVNS